MSPIVQIRQQIEHLKHPTLIVSIAAAGIIKSRESVYFLTTVGKKRERRAVNTVTAREILVLI